jgi:hypothetical protein
MFKKNQQKQLMALSLEIAKQRIFKNWQQIYKNKLLT